MEKTPLDVLGTPVPEAITTWTTPSGLGGIHSVAVLDRANGVTTVRVMYGNATYSGFMPYSDWDGTTYQTTDSRLSKPVDFHLTRPLPTFIELSSAEDSSEQEFKNLSQLEFGHYWFASQAQLDRHITVSEIMVVGDFVAFTDQAINRIMPVAIKLRDPDRIVLSFAYIEREACLKVYGAALIEHVIYGS